MPVKAAAVILISALVLGGGFYTFAILRPNRKLGKARAKESELKRSSKLLNVKRPTWFRSNVSWPKLNASSAACFDSCRIRRRSRGYSLISQNRILRRFRVRAV